MWLAFLVVFLAACQPAVVPAPVAETPACEPPNYQSAPGDCCLDADANKVCDRDQPVAAAPEPQAVAPAPASPAVSDAIAKFNQNVSSYYFKIGRDEYFVRGKEIHIKLGTFRELPFKYNGTMRTHITDIFIDRTRSEAIAYCDPRTEEEIVGEFNADRSKCIKLIDIQLPLDYKEYNPELPEDWLQKYLNKEPMRVEDTDQFIKLPSGWKTVNPVLHFQDGGKTTILRLDGKTGLPLKIETTEGTLNKITSFDFFVHNTVKPEQLVHKPFAR
jgi:hypothetical protein